MSTALRVRGVTKTFPVHHPNRPHTLHEALTRGFGFSGPRERFRALDAIDLEVETGAGIGFVGSNGAGKSTLLRLIAGVGRPDTGSIEVHGRIAALLELGAGFHPDLTGRENVVVAAVVQGLSRAQVHKRFDEIVAFSELEPFIDNPLRTFSTGMRMRLAFAISTQVDPDILVVDEVLAVGDYAFQHKCMRRIRELREAGCTLVLCSHDLELIRELCNEALWIEHGSIRARGTADAITAAYLAHASA